MANNLNILAFDTSTDVCTVALYQQKTNNESDSTLVQFHAPRQHTQLILSMIESVLAEAGLTLSQVSLIAVGVGPGSFTGCRLAVSVAKGLAMAHHLPIVPVSSMAAMAMSVFLERGDSFVLVSLDARTGQIYRGGYHFSEDAPFECIISEQVSPRGEVFWDSNHPWVGVGDGFDEVNRPAVMIEDACPGALAVAKLGLALYQQGVSVTPADLEPHYLR